MICDSESIACILHFFTLPLSLCYLVWYNWNLFSSPAVTLIIIFLKNSHYHNTFSALNLLQSSFQPYLKYENFKFKERNYNLVSRKKLYKNFPTKSVLIFFLIIHSIPLITQRFLEEFTLGFICHVSFKKGKSQIKNMSDLKIIGSMFTKWFFREVNVLYFSIFLYFYEYHDRKLWSY